MFKLTFADIRRNLKLFFGTFVAVLVAAAIITACLNLVFSATANFSYGERFSNVDLVLVANQQILLETVQDDGDVKTDREAVKGRIPIGESQLEELRANYNILEDYTFFIEPADFSSKKLAGHNISSMDFTGFTLSGSAPHNDQVVIDEDLAALNNLEIGDVIEIYTNAQVCPYEISGIASSIGKEDYALQNYIFFSDEVGKTNAKGCQSVAILDVGVSPDQLDTDGFRVFTGSDTAKAEQSDIIANDISLMVIFITMGAVCLVISLFVIGGAMKFSIKNRYYFLAQLRILGLKKSQICGMLSVQTMLISLVGASIGAGLSAYVADFIAARYLDMGIVSPGFTPIFSLFWAFVVVLAITSLSVLVTTLTASKPLSIPPATAIKSEGDVLGKTPISVVLLGFVLVLGGVAILIFAPMTQGIGIGMVFCASTLFLGGAICLMPLLVRFFNVILSVTVKRASKSLGQVAYGNIKMKASKFAVASVSIAIMMSMGSVMMLSNDIYMEASIGQQYGFADEYDFVSSGKFQYQTEGHDRIFAVKKTTFVLEQGRKLNEYNVLSVLGGTPDLDFVEKADDVTGDVIWVSDQVRNVEIGETLWVYLENGEKAPFVVGGIFKSKGITDENYTIVCDYEAIKHSLYSEKLATVYSANVIFHDSMPHNLEYYENSVSYDIQSAASILLGIIGLVLSVVALFNTFFVIMSVRTKEFHKLRLIGARKQQILSMTCIEVFVVSITGMAMGTAVIIACVGTYTLANLGVFTFVSNPTIFFGTMMITAILSLIAGMLPSFLTIFGMKRQFRAE